MKTENPIILNTGGIGAVSIDMTHTNCACKLICDCEDENSKPLKIIITPCASFIGKKRKRACLGY